MSKSTANAIIHARRPVSRLGRVMLWLWIAFVVLGVLALLGLRFFADTLADNQWPFLESGVLNVMTYSLIILATLGGLLWILLFSGRRWYWRISWCLLMVVLAAVPLVLFEPIFGGGLSLRGWRPRFWSGGKVLEPAEGTADLQPASDHDFPQFLGARRDGHVDWISLDSHWAENPPQQIWRKPIGPGWSGFATRNGFAVTMQQDGSRECVTCYRVDDGKLVWNYCIDKRHEDVLGGIGPRSTPTIDRGRVYALGALGMLTCIDGANGQMIWQRDLLELGQIATVQRTNGRGEVCTVEQSTVSWGRAASPLIYQSMVIVPVGGQHTLAAFDQETGDVVWTGGRQAPSYSSPVIAMIGGEPQIVIVNENTVSGHDPKTGYELWLYPWPGNSNGDASTSIAVPVDGDRILLTKGYGIGGTMLQLSRKDDRLCEVSSLWSSHRVLKTKLTNAIVQEGNAFAISSEVLECVDLASGERRWRASTRFGHGQLLLVGKHLLAHTEDGELVLAEANPEAYRELGRIKTIDGVCWNTIALYGNRVLVRSDSEAACFQLSEIKSQ